MAQQSRYIDLMPALQTVAHYQINGVHIPRMPTIV